MTQAVSEWSVGVVAGVSEIVPSPFVSASFFASASDIAVETRPDWASSVAPLCAVLPLWEVVPLWAPVESVPEVVAVVVAAPVTRTGRKSIWEEERIRSSVSLSGWPGRDTTMLSVPMEVISASATPEASTRLRMMLIASVMSALVTSLSEPSALVGVRISWVPPSRSSARLGVRPAPRVACPTSRAQTPMTTTMSRVMSERAGRRRVVATGGIPWCVEEGTASQCRLSSSSVSMGDFGSWGASSPSTGSSSSSSATSGAAVSSAAKGGSPTSRMDWRSQ